MDTLIRTFKCKYQSLQRLAFSTNAKSNELFYDLDDLIRQKNNFLTYLQIEYSLSFIHNLLLSLSILISLIPMVRDYLLNDFTSTIWLLTVSILSFTQLFPKLILYYQMNRIVQNSNDQIICSRRLMHMTRSNIFYLNNKISKALYFCYVGYFLLVRKAFIAENMGKLYSNINLMIFVFSLRLCVGMVNFNFYFKFNLNEADVHNASNMDYCGNQISPDILDTLQTLHLNKENLALLNADEEDKDNKDVCCICMNHFCLNETLKILPCNSKHIFHKGCIEKWLSHNRVCPKCRKEVSKKSVDRLKMF